MKTRLLVIGSGWEQVALLEEAKLLDYELIATHPVLSQGGLKLADHFFIRDSRDIKAHLELAQTYKVDGIVTDNCDYSFQTATFIAKALNLPFAPIQSATYSTNKFAQRVACKENGIVQPEFYLVENVTDIEQAAAKIGYPLIVKPVDSRGTFGVTIVWEAQYLETAFLEAVMNSPSRRIICEKFIEGVLVTVDGFCFRNGHQSLTVASRNFAEGPKPVTKEIIYPAQFKERLNKRLLENHNRCVNALGYQYGHTHGEYIVTKDKDIYLVECTNRGGGVYTSSTIVPNLTNINLNKILIYQSLGIDEYEVKHSPNGYMNKAVLLTFLDFEVGKVIKKLNVNELQALDFVLKFRTIFGVKDMVEAVEDCASRHSMLVIEGKDAEEAYKNLAAFKSKMNIEYYNI